MYHNNAHYDSNQQVCCNYDDGYPSTRDYSAALVSRYKFDAKEHGAAGAQGE
jgi:hypothetical protein